MKPVLLVVAQHGYQPVEYGHTRKELEAAGFQVQIASNNPGTASALPGPEHGENCDDPHCTTIARRYPQFANVAVDVGVGKVNVSDYSGIFLIGGPGALHYLDNQETQSMLKAAHEKSLAIGAICISPRILAHAGLLQGKQATGWDGDQELANVFRQYSVSRSKNSVVTHDNIVTADGPAAAEGFGKAIVALLKR